MKISEKTTEKSINFGQILAGETLRKPQPCVYYLIDVDNEVVYIGQTLNLRSRLLEHRIAGVNFVRFRYFTCDEHDLDRLHQEALSRLKAEPAKPPRAISTSGLLSKPLICMKHNITPLAFDRLRETFGLKPAGMFGNAKYYKPEDVDAWVRRFKGLVVSGRHVLQARPTYMAVGISARTKQIQLYTKR